MKLLCKLGLHRWGGWHTPLKGYLDGVRVVSYARNCKAPGCPHTDNCYLELETEIGRYVRQLDDSAGKD